MPGRPALSRRHDSSEFDLGRPGDHRGHRGHRGGPPRTLVHASFPDHPRRCPHSPHTISNRTISSVATNTNRVSPTLCHILRAGGWGGRGLSGGRQSGRAAWAAGARGQRPQGAGLGGAEAGRGGTGPQTCPRPGRPSLWRSGPRGATTASSLRGAGATASGEAGDGRTSCHGGRRGGKRELEVARRTPGPGCGSREVPSALGDARCQPLPKAAAAAPPLPAPSPAVAHHQAPTPQRLSRLRGACWEM